MPSPVKGAAPRLAAAALLALGWSAAGEPSASGAPRDAGAAQSARAGDAALRTRLARTIRSAGRATGAYVANASEARAVFRWRSRTPRVLASNTKLFTTAAALARFGVEGTLGTELRGTGSLGPDGVFRGDLYLRGGGDPSFGSRSVASRLYGAGATVDALAAKLEKVGVRRVAGSVYGDESRFDSRRGGPASRYGVSIYVGPLSALSYNRGLATERGHGYQSNPPLFAAARLEAALERRGLRVDRGAGVRRTPVGAQVLASVDSPPMGRLVRITNKPSDNFFAEMMLKALALQATGKGTTAGGARVASAFARRLGARARLVDGSGLSRTNRAAPARVARLLLAMRARAEFRAFYDSLPIAGRDGTLSRRMRSGPARRRCRAKTGTLAGVSALSGYCRARSGDTYVFSFLMNGVSPVAARRLQDRMAQAIAAVRAPAVSPEAARAGAPRR